jgi:hypothetical protein
MYGNSIIQDKYECWFCHSKQNLHYHHIYGGANRRTSDEYGFTVYLCAKHHNLGGNGKCVHQCREMDLELKRECQMKFEETHTREEFRTLIGVSYL